MVLFVVGVIFFLVGLGFIFGRKIAQTKDGVTAATFVGVILIVGALVTVLFSCLTKVPTKEEGIVTSFGHPVGKLGNGLHFIGFWEQVHTMDAAIQTDKYTSAQDGNPDCISIRIGNQSIACADVSVVWRIKPGSAPELYQDYRSFDHVRDNVVTRNLITDLNVQFASYNPLAIVQQGGTPQDVLPEKQSTLLTQLQDQVSNKVEVTQVLIPVVHYDQATQDKINQYQQAVADTRIAGQRVLTAEKEAAANNALSDSIKRDPAVLTSKCLDMVQKLDGRVPIGFSCFGTSGSTSVIVPKQ